MRSFPTSLIGITLALLGAGCANDDRPGLTTDLSIVPKDDAGPSASAEAVPPETAPSENDAGAARDASSAAITVRGQSPLPEPFDEVPVTVADGGRLHPAECPSDAQWPLGSPIVELEDIEIERLLHVTPNGRYWLIAALEPTASDAGSHDSEARDASDAELHDAGPPSTSIEAGAGQSLALLQLQLFDLTDDQGLIFAGGGHIGLDYAASGGATVSREALQLIVTRADGRGFGVLTRESTDSEFGEPHEEPFVDLNELAIQSGLRFSEPTLSADGSRLYYVGSHSRSDVYVAELLDDRWQFSRRLNPDYLNGLDGAKRVTGLTPDELTLLYYDENEDESYALFRQSVVLPFQAPLNVTAGGAIALDAQIGDGCQVLFYRDNNGKLRASERLISNP